MQSLPEHIEQSIRERRLLRRGDRILVAVSGGLDSMVLLHLLRELVPRFKWKLCVAHFNHQLRGRASDADERFVRQAAQAAGLPCRVGRGDVKALARRAGLSVEMAARQLRHAFLARTARASKCRTVALAHHADDQLELFFLRLLRGAGGDGLAGMKWHSVSPANRRVQVLRPMLDLSKAALREFAEAQGLRYREDATNHCPDILRNRLRHELLPLLRRRFQPALDRTILRTMEIVGAEAELVHEAALAWLKLSPARRRIADAPIALRRRIVQLQLQRLGIAADFELIESLHGLPNRPVAVATGLSVRCDAAGRLWRVSPAAHRFRRQRVAVSIRGASGSLVFGGAQIRWRQVARPGAGLGKPGAGQEVFDADSVGSRIILRHWRAGDRFQPIGMAVAVKVQDWFTNRKIPRTQRRALIVATTARGEIFWIEGQRIGERFKLSPTTRRRLDWRWNRP